MLLSEMVRKIREEENLFSHAGPSNYSGVHDWTTRITANISLSSAKRVLVRFDWHLMSTLTGSATAGGGVRVLCNGVICLCTGYRTASFSASGTAEMGSRFTILNLPAGSYTFEFQTSSPINSSISLYVGLKNIAIGAISFSDFVIINDAGDSGNISVPDGSTVTVIEKSITLPSARRTCAGVIKNFFVQAVASVVCEGYAGSRMKNPGESDEALLNWRLLVNGVQTAWTERVDDYQTNNQAYCEGAYGRYEAVAQPGSTITIRIAVYNNSGSPRTVRARLSLFTSPWILPSTDSEIFSLSFPQGSTLYLILEPFSSNPTKTVKLGKRRAASFGDSTDFYSTASGTGILAWNYTFESVEVEQAVLLVSGLGGCISIIAVDVRG